MTDQEGPERNTAARLVGIEDGAEAAIYLFVEASRRGGAATARWLQAPDKWRELREQTLTIDRHRTLPGGEARTARRQWEARKIVSAEEPGLSHKCYDDKRRRMFISLPGCARRLPRTD